MNSHTKKPLLLIVDDEPENLWILTEIFGDSYELATAINGPNALNCIKNNPPDLILLDIMLPKMDGYEVLRCIKADKFTYDIPVIFVTALTQTNDIAMGLTMGAVDYITKPINPMVVRARVNTHIKLKQQKDRMADLIQDREQTLNALKESHDLLEARVEERTSHLDNILRTAINLSIIATDLDYNIIYHNPTAIKLLRFQPEEVIGRSVAEMHAQLNIEPSRFERGMKNVQLHGEHIYQFQQPPEKGGAYIESRVSPILNRSGVMTGYILMSRDITATRLAEEKLQHANDMLELRVAQRTQELEDANTHLRKEILEREHLEQQLREQSDFDSLTKLPNRKLFHDRLQQAVLMGKRTKQSFALMFIDLDRFKWVNDTLGHAAGDELLIETAKRLQTSLLRKSDTVARLGGDEFTVILMDVKHPSVVNLVAQKILDQMSLPFLLKNKEICISCSVGIVIFPHDGLTAEELLKNADHAMYQAKEAGRNGFHCFSAEK
ncbi:MAG: diguanylate cyclase [Magnetococcales bacterium]|nr:diguanylate cyclase [Magnetococcales bacterium]